MVDRVSYLHVVFMVMHPRTMDHVMNPRCNIVSYQKFLITWKIELFPGILSFKTTRWSTLVKKSLPLVDAMVMFSFFCNNGSRILCKWMHYHKTYPTAMLQKSYDVIGVVDIAFTTHKMWPATNTFVILELLSIFKLCRVGLWQMNSQ